MCVCRNTHWLKVTDHNNCSPEESIGPIYKTVPECRQKFFVQVHVDEKHNVSTGIFVKGDTGPLQSVFGSDRKEKK